MRDANDTSTHAGTRAPGGTQHAGLDRRRFLKAGAVAVATATAGVPARPAAASDPHIRERRTLGRTGLEIADIGYGSSRTTDPAVVSHALARGIDYFDTAESYKGGESETSIGQALAGHREKVVLASKVSFKPHHTRADAMKALEGSLRRLRTDRIEIYFNHAVNAIERLQNDEWYAFAEQAKTQGKIRFTGISGHGGNLVDCIDHAVEHDLADVILAGYNWGQDPAFYQRFLRNFDFVAPQVGLPEALDRARAKGIGVIAMKTLRGARLNDMRPYEYGGATTAQAAFRWTLRGGHVDSLVVSMTSKEQVDEYVAASGAAKPTAAELDWLDRYLAHAPEGYCEHGCSACETSCPAGVPISEVLRTRMYARDYDDLAYARENYARLAENAAACSTCAAPCAGSCPASIDVPRLTRDTHRLLG
jgi:hypothetical protein